MSKERNDGKIAVSFRIPIELERALNRYCVWRDDKIFKSDLITQLISNHLESQGISVKKEEEKELTAEFDFCGM